MDLKRKTKKGLDEPRKKATIRTSLNHHCVPGKHEPAFAGLADLQNPPHKWHGFRIFAHNPEVNCSNPLPVIRVNQSPSGSGFALARHAQRGHADPRWILGG
jgi:hypothetical protein